MKRFLVDTTASKTADASAAADTASSAASASGVCAKRPCTNDKIVGANAAKHPVISGLHYWTGFVDHDTEKLLLYDVADGDWSSQLKRRVQHYGFSYNYKMRTISKRDTATPFTPRLTKLAQKIVERLNRSDNTRHLPTALFNQCIVNEYKPGQGISPHVDCVTCFGDTIASLTMASGTVMRFEEIGNEKRTVDCWLPPKSLIVLTGDARYKWRHSIAARKSDRNHGKRSTRISLTFRSVILKD